MRDSNNPSRPDPDLGACPGDPAHHAPAGDNAQVWIIPEALHCNGPTVRPEEYSRQLVEFFDQA